ncbi:hypothetical protein DSO57_1035527 [Entomophthora muscae]|uniref:Uncharacterized protein n=1 Tax=Entomophthora muscae TaxID=34485 RepID=A0ACC2UKM7_9FUNG|nr:hypothetical protein DSO57_1035527 [Entomophthora muscae]
MEPHVIPKPIPASLPNLPTNHTSKLFGIVYITLTGKIDTTIPAAGLLSWVGKFVSYLFNLAPLLWWALAAKNLAWVTPGTTGQLPNNGSLTLGPDCGDTSMNFPMMAHTERHKQLPNEGKRASNISLINLSSALVSNLNASPKKSTD